MKPTKETILNVIEDQIEEFANRLETDESLTKEDDDFWAKEDFIEDDKYYLEVYKAIYSLIEQKPKVTKEFVERWATFWQDDFSGFTLDHIKDHIEAMFAEIKGIEIEEENE